MKVLLSLTLSIFFHCILFSQSDIFIRIKSATYSSNDMDNLTIHFEIENSSDKTIEIIEPFGMVFGNNRNRAIRFWGQDRLIWDVYITKNGDCKESYPPPPPSPPNTVSLKDFHLVTLNEKSKKDFQVKIKLITNRFCDTNEYKCQISYTSKVFKTLTSSEILQIDENLKQIKRIIDKYDKYGGYNSNAGTSSIFNSNRIASELTPLKLVSNEAKITKEDE